MIEIAAHVVTRDAQLRYELSGRISAIDLARRIAALSA
jgi:hypothetical protein